MRQGFPKTRRLLRKSDYDAVFQAARQRQEGGSYRWGPFIIYWKVNEQGSRLGLSIARRVIKSAVKRNRIKRLLREYFRTLPSECRGDYIVRVMSKPPHLTLSSFSETLNELIDKKRFPCRVPKSC